MNLPLLLLVIAVSALTLAPQPSLGWTQVVAVRRSRPETCSLKAVKTDTAIDVRAENDCSWTNQNVLAVPSRKEFKEGLFRSIVPLVIGNGCDVTVRWTDPATGAKEMIDKCFHHSPEAELVQGIIQNSFQEFQLLSQREVPAATAFKARLISTRGSKGAKCPRWHFDHVPVRWIQSFVGPGCEYAVSEEGVNRPMINQVEESVENEVNQDLLDESVADIRTGKTGEAIVLRGLDGTNKPAVHRSPTLQPWQGRVLLTIDIVP